MAEALLAEDNTLLVGILQERALAKQLAQQKEDAEINRLNANPYDQDAQV